MDLANINLNYLKTFLAIYEEGSMARAAVRLGITTPSINHNIKELERQLGIQLFIGHSKGVTPTSEANELHKHVKAAFSHFDEASNFLSSAQRGVSGIVRIGCPSSIANLLMLDFFTAFNKAHPKITLEFVSDSKNAFGNNVDIVISFSDIEVRPDLTVVSLRHLPTAFFATKEFAVEHNLTNELPVERIPVLPLILFKKSRFTVNALEKALGEKLSPSTEVSSIALMFNLVKSGAGIGYFSESHIDNDMFKIKVKGVSLPDMVIRCAYNEKRLSPSSKILVNALVKQKR